MKSVRLFYFNKIQNFGDALNLQVMENLFNIRVERSDPARADLVAIGSLLEAFLWRRIKIPSFLLGKYLFLKPILVYGSGFIKAPKYDNYGNEKTDSFYRKLDCFALRGHYTEKRIENVYKSNYSNFALGDPGLLANSLINKDAITKKYSIGIIPHYMDKESPAIYQLANSIKHSKIIDIVGDPIDILTQIAECETVFSTAMHGLIAADSLGIPNKWGSVSDELIGGKYKFRDYYSVYEIDDPHCIDLNQDNLNQVTPEKIASEYKIDYNKVNEIQKNLLKAFPY